MYSKLENKMLNEMSNLLDKQVFYTYLKCMKNYDFEMASAILEEVSPDVKKRVEEMFKLYTLKIVAINSLSLSKLVSAVAYYNRVSTNLIGLFNMSDQLKGIEDSTRVDTQKQIKFWELKLNEIEEKSKGYLDLEEFEPYEGFFKYIDFYKFLDDYMESTSKVQG